jgi:hypothetical protein
VTAPITDVVRPDFREAVAAVVRHPTIMARASEESVSCHPEVYDWLLEHPDRTSLAWQRRNIPCVPIGNPQPGQFTWTDPNGSELTWEVVGRFADGVIWFAQGKVKPAPVLPVVPVKAVAVLHAPRTLADAHGAIVKPSLSVYLSTDSRAAAAVLRLLGPAAPRAAEQGAEQMLLFYSGIAEYLHRHPHQTEELLSAPAKR